MVYFDDRAVRVLGLFMGQMRAAAAAAGLSLAVFTLSDRVGGHVAPVLRLVSVTTLAGVAWFAMTAERQFVRFVADIAPGPARSDLAVWRAIPYFLCGVLATVLAAMTIHAASEKA